MSKLLEISNEELELVIQNTADKLNMSKAIVEKDLWVCMILKYLFNQFKHRDAIVFKGGTSLSKVYNSNFAHQKHTSGFENSSSTGEKTCRLCTFSQVL
ncbi:hypothetical protein TAMA11512_07490 [Selenomonas sp. TAMA-11512]|uniref:hypothetical protein n=1 Tax=Selenomonas sp. TAMA-11512 TaxID=3095337 RepID=UPI0030852814|nr:hypothetical protein TAMA11512_07490 [Selenomonas sp. TAMA-11512]